MILKAYSKSELLQGKKQRKKQRSEGLWVAHLQSYTQKHSALIQKSYVAVSRMGISRN